MFLSSPGPGKPGEEQRSSVQQFTRELAEIRANSGVWSKRHDPYCQEETSNTAGAGSRSGYILLMYTPVLRVLS